MQQILFQFAENAQVLKRITVLNRNFTRLTETQAVQHWCMKHERTIQVHQEWSRIVQSDH